MKLDTCCIRDTLLVPENWLVLNDDLAFIPLDLCEICKSGSMQKYSKSDIAYTLVLLEEAGFIEAEIDYTLEGIHEIDVIRLTFQGHQFLDTIRPESIWKKIHGISEKTGLKSITAIMEIANTLLPDAIKSAIHSLSL